MKRARFAQSVEVLPCKQIVPGSHVRQSGTHVRMAGLVCSSRFTVYSMDT